MNLQYISDSTGKTTGVFIPIEEWNELKLRHKGIEEESIEIPSWQSDEVRERLHQYNKNPQNAVDFDKAMVEIEKNM